MLTKACPEHHKLVLPSRLSQTSFAGLQPTKAATDSARRHFGCSRADRVLLRHVVHLLVRRLLSLNLFLSAALFQSKWVHSDVVCVACTYDWRTVLFMKLCMHMFTPLYMRVFSLFKLIWNPRVGCDSFKTDATGLKNYQQYLLGFPAVLIYLVESINDYTALVYTCAYI